MNFDPGFPITVKTDPMGFVYGNRVYGPTPELRTLDSIRPSLMDPGCSGPEIVYCIAMDVALEEDRRELESRHLLYGVVTYAKGSLGKEPIRSQGHIHAVSASCGSSTCEVYEIWEGRACIYMQESGSDNAGNCYAVCGNAGDVIIVPPGWVHVTINACPDRPMTFGAWCIRDYGFDYRDVRGHGGIAFFSACRRKRSCMDRERKIFLGQADRKRGKGLCRLRSVEGCADIHAVQRGSRPLPLCYKSVRLSRTLGKLYALSGREEYHELLQKSDKCY